MDWESWTASLITSNTPSSDFFNLSPIPLNFPHCGTHCRLIIVSTTPFRTPLPLFCFLYASERKGVTTQSEDHRPKMIICPDALGKSFPMVLFLLAAKGQSYFIPLNHPPPCPVAPWTVQRGWEILLCKSPSNPHSCPNKPNQNQVKAETTFFKGRMCILETTP